MADTVRDRYQRAMRSASPDAVTMLARAMQGGGRSGANPQAAPMPAYQMPFAGLKNDAALPPFEQPGGSLPMDRYMPQAMAEPHQGANMPVTAPPTPMPQPMPQQQMEPQPVAPMTTEPVPQNLGDPAIAALAEALRQKKQVSPWAMNEGNFMDQYG